MINFMYKRIWEMIALTLASSALATFFISGFFIPDDLIGQFWPVLGVCALLNIALYAFSCNRKATIAGIAFFLVLATVFLIILFNDDNPVFLYLLLVAASDIVLYFMTRIRLTSYLILPVGIIIIACDVILEYADNPLLYILFILASSALLIIRLYHFNMLSFQTKRNDHHSIAAVSIAVCAVCLILSVSAYTAIIKPLSPNHYEPVLRTALMHLPILEKLGISSHIYLPDPDKNTDQTNEDEMIGNLDNQEDPNEEIEDKEHKTDENEDKQYDNPDEHTPGNAISYHVRKYIAVYLIVLMLLFIVCGVILIREMNKKRLERLLSMPKKSQITIFYNKIIRGIELCGLPGINENTPKEYSEIMKEHKNTIADGQTFKKLTSIFERAYYGEVEPGQDEYDMFKNTYLSLRHNVRSYLGTFKYLLSYFKL